MKLDSRTMCKRTRYARELGLTIHEIDMEIAEQLLSRQRNLRVFYDLMKANKDEQLKECAPVKG
jgi:hypothetical protein